MGFLSNEQSLFSSSNTPSSSPTATLFAQQMSSNSASSIFDDLLPPVATSIQTPSHSFMNLPYSNSTNDSTAFLNQQHNTTYPY